MFLNRGIGPINLAVQVLLRHCFLQCLANSVDKETIGLIEMRQNESRSTL